MRLSKKSAALLLAALFVFGPSLPNKKSIVKTARCEKSNKLLYFFIISV